MARKWSVVSSSAEARTHLAQRTEGRPAHGVCLLWRVGGRPRATAPSVEGWRHTGADCGAVFDVIFEVAQEGG